MVGRIAIRLVLSLGLVVAALVAFAIAASAATGNSDISVTKTGPAGVASGGGSVTYSISVTDNGPDDATNVFMDDFLPAGEAFVSVAPASGCDQLPPVGGGGLVECITPTLTNGSTVTYTLSVQVASTLPDGTLIRNTATVQADQTDPVPSNNSSSTTLTLGTPQTDISVTKTGPATATPGNNFDYTITVANNGPDGASLVAMNDTLPAAVSFVSLAFGPGTVIGTSCNLPPSGGGGAISCQIPTLASGQSTSFIITVQLLTTVPDGSVVTNTATASPGPNQVDPNTTNNTSSVSLTVVVPDKDLAITAGVSPAPVQATSAAGAAVTFASPTASDEDGPVAVTCNAVSGSVFPVGSTNVSCSATDTDDTPSKVTTSLTVTVVDKDLALTGVPAPITMNATSPAGATVTYTPPTATDEETPPAVTCDHPSGSTFPIGTTTVTCSATDTDDTPSSASATFTVTVAGAAGQLQDLLNFVQPLPPGTSFSDKVNSALSYLGANDTADACGVLNAIINQANAQSGKQLTTAQAAQIVAMAKQIRAVIPCP